MTTPTVAAPKVTVLVMTYNHIRFIERALASVLQQRTDFPYEVLISEDCSTDGTRELVIAYQQKYPDRIRLLLSEKNLHSNAVVARGIDAAQGRYTALLDGDDYWTCEDKLQKQADFLDRHPQCSICFHNAVVVHEDGSRPPWNWVPVHQKAFSGIADMWLGNFIPTCSTMYRNGLFGKVPDWYSRHYITATLFITDWPLHLLHAEHGQIGYIDAVMGTYRYHAGGIYSGYSEHEKLEHTLTFYRSMNVLLEHRHQRLVDTAISKYFLDWAQEYLQRGDHERARTCFERCLLGAPLSRRVSAVKLLKVGAQLYLRRRSASGRQAAACHPQPTTAPSFHPSHRNRCALRGP
jgi:glycosyltransferase involved in cell wall biosynthesis